MKVTANSIKASVAAYWRYSKQYPFVALEANCQLKAWNDGGQADVLAITKDRYLIEVEVKLSMADLQRDKNKVKHRNFRDGLIKYPTRLFYFAVPKELANKVSILCDNLYPYAGVLGSNGLGEADVEFYRKPRPLWGTKLTFSQILRMVREQSATVCRLARKLADIDNKTTATV